MPTLIDSHCHLDRLDLTPFDGDMDAMMAEAKALDVEQMIAVCVDMENAPVVARYAEQYDHVFASVGKHPCDEENQGVEPTVAMLVEQAKHPKVVAIGETGLDYFRTEPGQDMSFQHQRFITHIEAAKQSDLPLIIHTRAAREDTIAILKAHDAGPGVFHCFTESWEMAKAGLDLGLYISFSGIVTFKNAQELQEVAKKVPLDRILVETDAPSLTPVPYRGKPNHPGYPHYVAHCLAELRGVSYAAICEATTQNTRNLFAL